MIIAFIALQTMLLLLITLHDWVHIPPFTDIALLKKHHSTNERLVSSLINSLFVTTPLCITLATWGNFSLIQIITIIVMYCLLTIGTLCAWWIPYIFGSSQLHKNGFIEYKNTHTFLPRRGDNIVPNTIHIIIHLLIWICLGIAIKYLAA